jgi:nucleoside-diphosphate-sugar epimerase
MSRRVLIVGCGYVGLALGTRLVQTGHAVFGLRRSPGAAAELAAVGITPLAGDLTRTDDLSRLPGPFDWVVNTVSSSRGGVAEYRDVYLDGTRNLLTWLRDRPPERLVYTSSTSVYGQIDGSWVDESSPTVPAEETGRVLVETETELLKAARVGTVPGIVLRVAGIYGPGRGHLFQQFLRGEARIQGDGSRWLNMVHRDDVAGAIHAALERGQPGNIYNAADNEPVSQLGFLSWIAAQLDRPLPPAATEAEDIARKRGLTHKRVSNRKLREELGWKPRFPTFREGYAAEIAKALAAAG